MSFEEGNSFLQILQVEVDRDRRLRRGKNSADIELQIYWKNRSLDDDAVADFPAKLLGQFAVDHRARLIFLPGRQLIIRNLEVRRDLEDFVGIGSELGEKILRLLVFVQTAKPLRGRDRDHSGDGP